MSIAIVGAGMAGLAAARTLADAGRRVVVLDKSRGLGGRMATRRVDDLQFDHGAQYFTARGPEFRQLVAQWQAAGHVGLWSEDKFVGTPSMTAPARTLAEGLTVAGGRQVTSLSRANGIWRIRCAEGTAAGESHGGFSAVILAMPAPQAMPLVATAGLDMPEQRKVRYAPCWALMLAFDAPSAVAFQQLRPDDDAIAWIARDRSKPGRGGTLETFVVHAAAQWSRETLQLSPEDARAALLDRFRDITGLAGQPVYAAARRWRFALVEETAGVACLWNAEAGFGVCGDWCLGPRVEAAFDSGSAMARAVLQSRGAGHAS